MELLLGEDGNSQLLGLSKLGARRLPGYHVGGLFGHGGGGLAPPLLDEGGGLVPGEVLQGAGEHKGHARKALVAPLLSRRHVHPGLLQAGDEVLALRAGKPVQDALGSDGPDVVHSGELLQGGALDGVQGVEPGGQDFARLLPHLPDAEGVQQPGQVLLLGALNGGDQVLGGLLAHPLQGLHVLRLQEVQVPGGLDQTGVHQVLHHGDAQALNVHGVPGGEVGQIPQQLGGALGPGAADVGPVFVPLHRGPAHGAHRGEHIGDGPHGPLLPYHRQNLRDDLPRLAHQHRVPDAHVLLGNKILVVEGGVGDGSPRQPHRLQHRLGGEHPGTAHLDDDVHHLGGLHLRGILVGRRPPGKFRRAAQGLPLAQIVDLNDRPVDVKGELLPVFPDGGHPVHRLLNGGGTVMGNHFKVLGFQIVQRLQVGVERLPLRPLDVKDRNIQLPGGGHLGVQLPQGPGGGVPGVCKESLSPSLPLLVDCFLRNAFFSVNLLNILFS